jgi:hypothetical protein
MCACVHVIQCSDKRATHHLHAAQPCIFIAKHVHSGWHVLKPQSAALGAGCLHPDLPLHIAVDGCRASDIHKVVAHSVLDEVALLNHHNAPRLCLDHPCCLWRPVKHKFCISKGDMCFLLNRKGWQRRSTQIGELATCGIAAYFSVHRTTCGAMTVRHKRCLQTCTAKQCACSQKDHTAHRSLRCRAHEIC